MLNFNNSVENNLGIPLPKGTVRVFTNDKEGKLQFIGEDSIDHTPKDETISLFIGQAFDIVGERTQMDFNELANWYEYVWAVNFRNHKDDDIVVTVLERTSDRRYQKTKSSSPILVTPRRKAISIGFLLPNRDSSIIGRGPMKMNV